MRRRAEEFELIRYGKYQNGFAYKPIPPLAKLVLPLSNIEIKAMRASFDKLGYPPGDFVDGVLVAQVEEFQKDHGLTPDGVIGRATLSTLQRLSDARKKAANAGAGAAAGVGAGVALPPIEVLPLDPSTIGASGGLIWLLWTAWQYRDALAGLFEQSYPEIAKQLREL